ncbi:hypothetical protein L3Y34_001469 [Caenorhabditis briggsae]|nr:hypothetical protein L3Y34_001469 [Caenorhabditis briggsae]
MDKFWQPTLLANRSIQCVDQTVPHFQLMLLALSLDLMENRFQLMRVESHYPRMDPHCQLTTTETTFLFQEETIQQRLFQLILKETWSTQSRNPMEFHLELIQLESSSLRKEKLWKSMRKENQLAPTAKYSQLMLLETTSIQLLDQMDKYCQLILLERLFIQFVDLMEHHCLLMLLEQLLDQTENQFQLMLVANHFPRMDPHCLLITMETMFLFQLEKMLPKLFQLMILETSSIQSPDQMELHLELMLLETLLPMKGRALTRMRRENQLDQMGRSCQPMLTEIISIRLLDQTDKHCQRILLEKLSIQFMDLTVHHFQPMLLELSLDQMENQFQPMPVGNHFPRMDPHFQLMHLETMFSSLPRKTPPRLFLRMILVLSFIQSQDQMELHLERTRLVLMLLMMIKSLKRTKMENHLDQMVRYFQLMLLETTFIQ